MPLWWTKRSLPPSSGVTKPKPLSSLNHLTVPVAIAFLLRMWTANAGDAVRRRLRALNTTCAEHDARRLTRTTLPMCGGLCERPRPAWPRHRERRRMPCIHEHQARSERFRPSGPAGVGIEGRWFRLDSDGEALDQGRQIHAEEV